MCKQPKWNKPIDIISWTVVNRCQYSPCKNPKYYFIFYKLTFCPFLVCKTLDVVLLPISAAGCQTTFRPVVLVYPCNPCILHTDIYQYIMSRHHGVYGAFSRRKGHYQVSTHMIIWYSKPCLLSDYLPSISHWENTSLSSPIKSIYQVILTRSVSVGLPKTFQWNTSE